ncbi:MAG: 2OG-Fe(II) oxygenase [Bacteroidota bacterium]
MKQTKIQDGVWTIDNFLTTKECREWITFSEGKGYELAKVGTGRRQIINTTVRNNDRILYDDAELASDYYRRAFPYLVTELSISEVSGFNERFRFYRYTPGQRFRQHQDGSYIRNINEWSEFTFLIYLNDDFIGGATKFLHSEVHPKAGSALLFKHERIHEGCVITKGTKYVLRTDVMYRRKG